MGHLRMVVFNASELELEVDQVLRAPEMTKPCQRLRIFSRSMLPETRAAICSNTQVSAQSFVLVKRLSSAGMVVTSRMAKSQVSTVDLVAASGS